jgi:hypothetical protein
MLGVSWVECVGVASDEADGTEEDGSAEEYIDPNFAILSFCETSGDPPLFLE